ncbi:MAG: glycosyltransferase family A protein [Planctomycetia bacterium]
MKLLVLVPSRLARDRSGRTFLAKAIDSIAGQELPAEWAVDVEVSIGIDPGLTVPDDVALPQWARVSRATAPSQAAALNAASRGVSHDFVAIMEDDDAWLPGHLRASLAALRDHDIDFVSSTQLQVDETGAVLSIFDFPTPSGWVMRRTVWDAVGPFDASFRYHLDNDWLGRLGDSGFRRGHLVEVTAPVDPRWLAVRPWLHNVVVNGGPRSRLLRHDAPTPLVKRMVHAGSGMAAVGSDPEAHATSRREYERLVARYGRVPW